MTHIELELRQRPEKLSILLINQNWLASELKARGHRVVIASWSNTTFEALFPRYCHISDLLKLLPEGFQPDRIVYYDDSHTLSILGLEDVDVPTLFYSVDAHHHFSWHSRLGACFDKVLVAQKGCLASFEALSSDVSWFPLWAGYIEMSDIERTIDVCFRGTLDPELHPERAAFFKELGDHLAVDVNHGPYREAYPRAKIVVNQTVGNDLNFRVFEAMGCGALLVTPRRIPGQEELFQEGVHCVCYRKGDAADAAVQIKHYLEHSHERESVARRGWQEVSMRHSAQVRGGELEQHLLGMSVTERPRKYYAAAATGLTTITNHLRGCGKSANLDEPLRKVLLGSAELLIRAVERREAVDEAFEASVVVCRYFLQEAGLMDQARDLGYRLVRLCPQNVLFALCEEEDLRGEGAAPAAANQGLRNKYGEEDIEQLLGLMREVRTKVLEGIH